MKMIDKIESRTGKDQLRNVLGYLNCHDAEWETSFRGLIDLDKLNCSYLHHAQVNRGRLSDSEMQYFCDLMKEISAMVSNDQLYQVCSRRTC